MLLRVKILKPQCVFFSNNAKQILIYNCSSKKQDSVLENLELMVLSIKSKEKACRDSLCIFSRSTGPGCSKLTTSLVNVSLKFQTLISEKCQYFLLKKM